MRQLFLLIKTKAQCIGYCEHVLISSPFISDVRYFTKKKPSRCRSGFNEIGYQCLFKSVTNASWVDTQHICEKKGSHLAIIRNLTDNSLIESFLNNNNEDNIYWLGVSNDNSKNLWL